MKALFNALHDVLHALLHGALVLPIAGLKAIEAGIEHLVNELSKI